MSLRDRLRRDYEAEALADAASFDETGKPLAPVAERFKVPANMRQPGPAHIAIMESIDQVLTFALNMKNVQIAPAGLRTMVRLMRRMEGEMLTELASLPEEECINILRAFGTKATEMADELEKTATNGTRALPAEPAVTAGA